MKRGNRYKCKKCIHYFLSLVPKTKNEITEELKKNKKLKKKKSKLENLIENNCIPEEFNYECVNKDDDSSEKNATSVIPFYYNF